MYFFKILNWYKHGLINNDELTKLLQLEQKNSHFAKKDFLSLRLLGAAFIFMSALAFLTINAEGDVPFMEAVLALPILAFIVFAFKNLSDDYQEHTLALEAKASLNDVYIASAKTATLEKIAKQPSYYLTPAEHKNSQAIPKKPNAGADSILGLILRLIIVIAPLPYMKTILYVGAIFPGVLIYSVLGLKESQAEPLLFLLMGLGALLYLYVFYRLFRIYFIKKS